MEQNELVTVCLGCGRINELHSNADGDTPEPGDISVCWQCGNVAAFDADLNLVALTEEQFDYVTNDPDFQAVMRHFNKPTPSAAIRAWRQDNGIPENQ